MRTRVLIVEDEKNLGVTLQEYLSSNNYDCDLAVTIKEAKDLFSKSPHIVLMDVGLPDGSGIELAKHFFSLAPNVTTLFLSAQNDPEVRVQGLETGAIDYITKPFALKELMLKLERLAPKIRKSISFEDLSLNLDAYEIESPLNTYKLSVKERDLLKLLWEMKNSAVSRDKILETLWDSPLEASERTIDNYIVKLRKIFEAHPRAKLKIKSVRAVGYMLEHKE